VLVVEVLVVEVLVVEVLVVEVLVVEVSYTLLSKRGYSAAGPSGLAQMERHPPGGATEYGERAS